jgi:hypothetical protein
MPFITKFSGFVFAFCILISVEAKSLQFGPTGIEGSESKNTIKVTNTEKGSPAFGKLKQGDLIIGVNGKKFGKSPKHEIAAAIDMAETKKSRGKLTLILKGNKTTILTLPVLGSYSATAPYKCKKTDKIITQLAESLLKLKHGGGGVLNSGILGLMATGEKKYLHAATKLIKKSNLLKIDPKKVDALLRGDIDMGLVGWYWGYNLITLGEYYLLTKDKSVLPAIKIYALGLARGQDGGGLWGHRMATEKSGGRLPGYAQMNQSSLSCFMGMLFAQKCGIKDPVLDKAIKKTYDYFAYFVGRGAFPYGVHGPQTRGFNNNGMCGSAALCMSLYDNQKGALFFAKLSANGYDILEQGHGSNFFNPLWTPLGANLAGPKVTQQFFKKSLWFHNLKRKWDGSYGNHGRKEGPEASIALLNYCLPRKALMITGRGVDKSIWLNSKEATEAVMMSKIDYSTKSNNELITLAKEHPIPQVNRRASWELLTKRRKELTPTWISYLSKGTDTEKKLAASQFGYHTPLKEKINQLSKIGAILRNPKAGLTLRVSAAQSICQFGEAAHPYYMDMAKLLAKDRPHNPLNSYIDQDLGACLPTLCKTPFKNGLVTDKDIFYKAAIKLIEHKRTLGRTSGLKMLLDMPFKDLHRVIDTVMHVTKNKDATYESYHSIGGTLGTALTILAKHNIKDGLPYFMQLWHAPGKHGFKVRMICATLPKYRGNAKDVLDQLEKIHPGHNKSRFKGMWQKMAETIRNDKNPPKLITLKEALRNRK